MNNLNVSGTKKHALCLVMSERRADSLNTTNFSTALLKSLGSISVGYIYIKVDISQSL